jgi:hypothetical protein
MAKQANVGKVLEDLRDNGLRVMVSKVQAVGCNNDFSGTLASLEAQGVTDPDAELERIIGELLDEDPNVQVRCDCTLCLAIVGTRNPNSYNVLVEHITPMSPEEQREANKPRGDLGTATIGTTISTPHFR